MVYSDKKNPKWTLMEWMITLVIDALVLMLASTIFKGFYIESFLYAVTTSLVIILLDITVKPILKFITLPITFVTLGIFYPFINVIIMKIASSIMGTHFEIDGWIVPFFIAIFISFMTMLLDNLITKQIVGNK